MAVKKMRRQEVAIEQDKQDSQQRMANLEQEIQKLRAFHQKIEQLLEAKTKKVVEQTSRLAEQDDPLSRLHQELVQKDKFFVYEVEVYKGEAAQALLVGFKVAVEQASSLHPSLNFSQLAPNKKVVDGKLVEE